MKLPNTSIIFAWNISHRFRSFLIAFAQNMFLLLLPEFPIGTSGKSNGKFGQKQWENSGKSNEKTRKAAALYFGQKLLLLPEFPIAFSRISHCFCPRFPLLLPEFLVFNFFFFFFFFFGGGGHSAPPAPPPRLLRLWVEVGCLIQGRIQGFHWGHLLCPLWIRLCDIPWSSLSIKNTGICFINIGLKTIAGI